VDAVLPKVDPGFARLVPLETRTSSVRTNCAYVKECHRENPVPYRLTSSSRVTAKPYENSEKCYGYMILG
jgi:hypothetical protein